jgi:hypothetical protein
MVTVRTEGGDGGAMATAEVEYELTHDDLFAYQWRAAFTSARARRTRRTTYLGWFVAVLLLAIVPAIGADGITISRVSLTFIVVTFSSVALAQWFLERRLMRRAIWQLIKEEKPDRGQLGKHKVVLTPDGVRESTMVGESRTSWAGVDRVEQDPHYIFIYTTAVAAFLVPKRAFHGPQEAEAFYELSRSSRASAR